MQCPICEKELADKESFLQHMEEHKNKSILSRSPEPVFKINDTSGTLIIDTKNFFGKKHFEELIQHKVKNITEVDELVTRRVFVEQIKKIILKNPFIYLPYMIKDLFEGENSSVILSKYYIRNSINLQNIVQDVLNFNNTRYRKKQYENAFEMNLKIPTWKDRYDILQNNFEFFKNELLDLTFRNVLRSFILLFITDFVDTGISKQDIVTKAKALQTNWDIFRFIDKSLESQFKIFFDSSFDDRVYDIVEELVLARILKKKTVESDLYVGKLSIDNLKSDIARELKYCGGSQPEFQVRIALEEKYPSLRLMPGIGLWDTALSELENEEIVCPRLSDSKRSKMLFLSEDYERIRQNLYTFDDKNIKFYGRKVSPDEFVEELLELEKGDFDDEDDQVTRIAGLILAESVKLEPPIENISEFDFATDIENYQFRSEQLEAMAKLNFKINSKIFHCKVMLDEKLTLDKYNSLKYAVPENEQGIVFTFEKIPKNVMERLEQDKTIQVIDKEGLKIWVSITSQIPVRKKSIAKLHYDPVSKLDEKIVRVNLLNYENRMASVSVLPTMREVTVFAGSLEEIIIAQYEPKNFEQHSEQYLNFLHKLCELVPKTFDEGMFIKVIDVHLTHIDLLKNTRPELFEHGRYVDGADKSTMHSDIKYVQFENVHVKINTAWDASEIECMCNHKINEEYYFTLCKHQVAAINRVYLDELNKYKSKTNVLEEQLYNFQKNNIRRAIHAINDVIEPESRSFFKDWLNKCLKDCQDD